MKFFQILNELSIFEKMYDNNELIKKFFDEAFSFENGVILKIVIEIRYYQPQIMFCTVNDDTLDDVLFIHGLYPIVFLTKIKKHSTNDNNNKIFHEQEWQQVDITPFVKIDSTILPLNNDICGIIENKLFEKDVVFIERSEKVGMRALFNLEDWELDLYKNDRTIIIKINPYDYKNFEVRFFNNPEFKKVNIHPNEIYYVYDFAELVGYKFFISL
jgi:hypothetical protein